MAKIDFRTLEDTPSFVTRDRVPEGPLREQIGESELDNQIRMYFPGDPTHLQMFEAMLEPNTGPKSHAHHEDEIVFVLEGEMHFGSRVLRPGDCAHIPAYTLYSFRAGPEGLRFLNFRARANGVLISKEELRTVREQGKQGV
jgi:mannose-6-phosphate isomerase-like protein (cupin superfamily)